MVQNPFQFFHKYRSTCSAELVNHSLDHVSHDLNKFRHVDPSCLSPSIATLASRILAGFAFAVGKESMVRTATLLCSLYSSTDL